MLRAMKEKLPIANDATENVGLLIRLRLPWLIIGLVGGGLLTLLISRFEHTLKQDIHLAFFLPIIVYMSDAVGTQTGTIYVRNLSKKQLNLWAYLLKELVLGLGIGLILGLSLGLFAYFWLSNITTAWTVALAMFINITIAPVVALLIPEFFQLRHSDPAVGAGPFTTLIQDAISLMVYFTVATLIIF